jgi:hypothetical protein
MESVPATLTENQVKWNSSAKLMAITAKALSLSEDVKRLP